jgi:peptidoglycan-associated lipoprotein
MMSKRMLWMCAAAGLLGAAACGSKAKPAQTTPEVESKPTEPETGDRTGEQPQIDAEVTTPDEGAVSFDAIYFEFDSNVLSESSKGTLERIAAFLQKNPKATITIGGHTDERGTPEYNLALGERRAAAARDYLVRLGVTEGQIKTLTFGEEKPASSGSDESAWSKNRRDEFQVAR